MRQSPGQSTNRFGRRAAMAAALAIAALAPLSAHAAKPADPQPDTMTAAVPATPADSLLTMQDFSRLRLYHAYSASDGRTYIETIDMPSQQKTIGGTTGVMYLDIKPSTLRIGRSTANFLGDWHYAGDMRHIIIPLQDDIVFDTGDGTLFHLHPGEAILAEDWTGKGHRSGCWSKTHSTCMAIDILYDANPRQIPLRAPPKR